jgi:hypothetical protein
VEDPASNPPPCSRASTLVRFAPLSSIYWANLPELLHFTYPRGSTIFNNQPGYRFRSPEKPYVLDEAVPQEDSLMEDKSEWTPFRSLAL